MRQLVAPLAAVSLVACALYDDEPLPQPSPPPLIGTTRSEGEVPVDCPLSIAFGSYAMGIDTGARARIEALLVADPAVAGFRAHPWGREGETTLCVRTRPGADFRRLVNAIRVLIPARPRGPIMIRTLGGLTWQTPPPR